MRYVGKLYRPPSEAHSYILQATIGCSWNNCTYCDMYRDKPVFRVRPLEESLEDIAMAAVEHGPGVEKVFIADGDALMLDMDHWAPILEACAGAFPRLRQVSCYATADNIVDKTPADLERLRALGLKLLYIGPESGDEKTMRRIAKGPRPKGASRDTDYLFDHHVQAAQRAKAAGLKLSAIFLLGAGGVERSAAHAEGSARLVTAMDPEYLSALTLTVVPGTPLHRTQANSGWVLPEVPELLGELRTIVDLCRPTDAMFRTNHASNYLPLGGRLPVDRERILTLLDMALSGEIPLRPEWSRGL
jgi:radical SAM superfamily enzyme YgiQ (UPF0313 family)